MFLPKKYKAVWDKYTSKGDKKQKEPLIVLRKSESKQVANTQQPNVYIVDSVTIKVSQTDLSKGKKNDKTPVVYDITRHDL